MTVTTPLELVYFDLWGPTPVVYVQGFRYYILLVDAYTRYTWIYPLKFKSDALSIFTTFHKFAEIHFNLSLEPYKQIMEVNLKPSCLIFMLTAFSLGLLALTLMNKMVWPSENIDTWQRWD